LTPRRKTDAARVIEGPETEAGLTEGADRAIFRRGTGIDRQRHARTIGVEVRIAVADRAFTVIEREVIDAAVDRQVGAQITTQLDARIGARNVEESGTIERADPHIFDRFGLYGKISCLGSAHPATLNHLQIFKFVLCSSDLEPLESHRAPDGTHIAQQPGLWHVPVAAYTRRWQAWQLP
jgi:hypothetical protein